MKNKHLVFIFLAMATLVYFWNKNRSKHENLSSDSKLAAEFLEKYRASSSIVLSDGTEPDIKLLHTENGWSLNFGMLNAPADEDTIKAFLEELKQMKVCKLPVSEPKSSCSFEGNGLGYKLSLHHDTLSLTGPNGNAKTGLNGSVRRWLSKPYEEWLFRRLQTKAKQEIIQISYEWLNFPALSLSYKDSTWRNPDGSASVIPQAWLQDSLLPNLSQLNKLEPALSFDPVTLALKPFASLYLNDGKSGILKCYRITETRAEYYLQSSILPQVCFKLDTDLANTLFVKPHLKRTGNQ